MQRLRLRLTLLQLFQHPPGSGQALLHPLGNLFLRFHGRRFGRRLLDTLRLLLHLGHGPRRLRFLHLLLRRHRRHRPDLRWLRRA